MHCCPMQCDCCVTQAQCGLMTQAGLRKLLVSLLLGREVCVTCTSHVQTPGPAAAPPLVLVHHLLSVCGEVRAVQTAKALLERP